MGLITSKLNIKNSATACERKIPGGLHKKFEGHMGNWAHTDGKKYLFENSKVANQDYGNSKTQVVRG